MPEAVAQLHPAAAWAAGERFNAIEIDCTTTVVLKILDGKCKMSPGEKAAIMHIYHVVRGRRSVVFDEDTHQLIDRAHQQHDAQLAQRIHALRVYAEQQIPKPLMKKYKARLREGLFG